MAERFVKYLELGLECFADEFKDYNPTYVFHETQGHGLLFTQLKENDYGTEESVNASVIAFEHGISWPSGALIYFNNEQPPEQVALLFLAALLREIPVTCPHCGCAKKTEAMIKEEKDDDNDNCMRPFVPGLDD